MRLMFKEQWTTQCVHDGRHELISRNGGRMSRGLPKQRRKVKRDRKLLVPRHRDGHKSV
jgi:hypothetical protein